jgi:hypothetical protein
MKTQMKSDALLDAFEKQQLSKTEMSEISGGSNGPYYVKYVTPSGHMIHQINEDGSTVYYNIIGKVMTAEEMIENNDHYIVD